MPLHFLEQVMSFENLTPLCPFTAFDDPGPSSASEETCPTEVVGWSFEGAELSVEIECDESADSSGDPHLSLAHGGTAHKHVKSVPARVFACFAVWRYTVVWQSLPPQPPKPIYASHTHSLGAPHRDAYCTPKPCCGLCWPLCFK